MSGIKSKYEIYIDVKLQEKITPQIKTALAKFRISPASVDIEKLCNTKVHSIKFSAAGRLLLSIQGNKVIVLKILENHEYDRQLENAKRMASTLNKHPEQLIQESNTVEEKISDKIEKHEKLDFIKSNHVNLNITLDDALDTHQKVAIDTPLPSIISGPAGSGKTTIAHSIFNKAIQNNSDDQLLYITQSSRLRDYVANDFINHFPAHKGKVKFSTYREILSDRYEYLSSAATFDFIENFINESLKAKDNLLPESLLQKIEHSGTQWIHEELRIRSGYEASQYLDTHIVGKKQSLLTTKEERTWLNERYDVLMSKLENTSTKIPAFSELTSNKKYDLVIVDETQDFSNRQIASIIKKLSKNGKLVFTIGPGQSLEDDMSNRIFIEQILKNNDIPLVPNLVTFSKGYRHGPFIRDVANAINELRLQLTPKGKSEHFKLPKDNEQQRYPGNVECFAPNENIDSIKQLLESPDTCIIANSTQHQAACDLYGAKSFQVLTPSQVKGMEYENVIIFNPFAENIFRDIDNAMHRPMRNTAFSSPLSKFYVALTRAETLAYIVTPNNRKNIIGYINENINTAREKYFSKLSTPKTMSPDDHGSGEWEQRARALYLAGNDAHALSILMEKLNFSEEAANNFLLLPETEHLDNSLSLDKKITSLTIHTHHTQSANNLLLHTIITSALDGDSDAINKFFNYKIKNWNKTFSIDGFETSYLHCATKILSEHTDKALKNIEQISDIFSQRKLDWNKNFEKENFSSTPFLQLINTLVNQDIIALLPITLNVAEKNTIDWDACFTNNGYKGDTALSLIVKLYYLKDYESLDPIFSYFIDTILDGNVFNWNARNDEILTSPLYWLIKSYIKYDKDIHSLFYYVTQDCDIFDNIDNKGFIKFGPDIDQIMREFKKNDIRKLTINFMLLTNKAPHLQNKIKSLESDKKNNHINETDQLNKELKLALLLLGTIEKQICKESHLDLTSKLLDLLLRLDMDEKFITRITDKNYPVAPTGRTINLFIAKIEKNYINSNSSKTDEYIQFVINIFKYGTVNNVPIREALNNLEKILSNAQKNNLFTAVSKKQLKNYLKQIKGLKKIYLKNNGPSAKSIAERLEDYPNLLSRPSFAGRSQHVNPVILQELASMPPNTLRTIRTIKKAKP